jgi:hypothetical protein
MSQIQRFLIERITVDLIEMCMDHHQLDFEQATSYVMASETHMKLIDPETGLYMDSSSAVYHLLESERLHGKIVQLEL